MYIVQLAVAEKQVQDGALLDGQEVFAKLRKNMEDRFQLKVTPAAEHDLDEIYYYITNSLVAPQE